VVDSFYPAVMSNHHSYCDPLYDDV